MRTKVEEIEEENPLLSSEFDKRRGNEDMSEKDYTRMRSLQKENRRVNLGYAFITFSHADEAKLALYSLMHSYFEGLFIEAMPKGLLDHKDFDTKYVSNK
mmetsp:Transcript_6136/g.4643  ORF Transcript_6136/g.4643 Transcript_6136/m.4643 type:complete len:100 (+) Transcript_6136:405-704(+)